MQILEKRTETSELNTKKEILNAFNQRLYTPNELLKPMIIERLTEYLLEKLKDERYRLKIFSVNSGNKVLGVVVVMVHPTYTSYTRKCGTFGWLNCVNDFEVCKSLIESCEDFMRANKVRKMRGNINFPKGLGGMGIQTSGFDQQMMDGISFDDPYSEKASYLKELGYAAESEYICMYVTDERWNSAKKVDADIRLGFLSLDEMYARIDEFHELVRKTFQGSLPKPVIYPATALEGENVIERSLATSSLPSSNTIFYTKSNCIYFYSSNLFFNFCFIFLSSQIFFSKILKNTITIIKYPE